ncbi:amino acid transporter [Streptomyces sp. CB03238]|uniref:nucleotidyltransferase domain-containing protein n=1 Tax=Streptomyces sp. CB03238 TaxID=1907777 RepID=UPI001F4D397A|nr:amino acid transporter [Streptomyces sp. CB03238]
MAAVFTKAHSPWWIAGGYAIELAVGRELRPHSDLDVFALRRDQTLVRDLLADWDLNRGGPARPGEAATMAPRRGPSVVAPRHRCRRTPEAPWSVQLMLDEAEGTQWVSRRESAIRLPIDRLGRTSETGIPYPAPDVQLFYF